MTPCRTRKTAALHVINAFRAFTRATLTVSLWANAVQAGVIVLLALALVWQTARPDTIAMPFAVSDDGKVYRAVGLDEQMLSEAQIKTWFSAALIDCLTLGPNDFDRQTERCRENFTPQGFTGWLTELTRSHIAERIRVGLNLSELVPTGPVTIVEKRTYDGHLGFTLEMPARMTFSVGRQHRSWDQIIQGLVLRVRRAERRRGIALEQVRITAEDAR